MPGSSTDFINENTGINPWYKLEPQEIIELVFGAIINNLLKQVDNVYGGTSNAAFGYIHI